MKDPIVEELHRLRAEQMEKVDFDFDAFYRDLKEQERASQRPLQTPPEPVDSSHRHVPPIRR